MMHRLKFSIKTLSPIVLSSAGNSTVMTETHSAFSGSIIRGILATRFVEMRKLGAAAHADKDFRKIFYGGLRFLPANPEISSKRSFVMPMSLQRGKSGTLNGDKVQDLLEGGKPTRGYKTFRGFGVLDKEKFYTAQVKTNMFMHMSRSEDSERLAGKSINGLIYNYEAIDAGQTFCGEILGDKKLLRTLLDGLKLSGGILTAYVGRSRFTQYGKCLVTFGDIDLVSEKNFSERIFLRLDTPLIPTEDYFLGAREILTAEVIGKLGEKFSLGEVFASCVEVENFVVPWGMKRPRVSALAAGSVFELKAAGLTADDKEILADKIFKGFGTRTEEGFGQLRLWEPSKNFTVGKLDAEKPSRPKKLSLETITRAKKILKARLLEQVRLYAHEDAEKLRLQDNMTHFFSRLDVILSNTAKKNLRENFKKQLAAEIRGGSLFEEHLKKLEMANGQKFFDVFTGNATLPHEVRDLMKDSTLAPAINEIKFTAEDFSDDEFFSEYLTNFFRFARKLAASKGGEAHE